MVMIIFWASYIVLVLSLFMWLAEHPLSVGALILFLYIGGSVIISFSISFVVGVFLFLTGVSGIMVAFLYVVALCPNPVFVPREGEKTYGRYIFILIFLSLVLPLIVLLVSGRLGFNIEIGTLNESLQWLRDPCICGGLADLIPFLGLLLFLCIVSVVILCGQQKQCLGGQGFAVSKRAYV